MIIKKNKFSPGKERNLFIINYPLQLLNAIEAQKHFKTKNNILIIFYYESQYNNYNQLMKLIELFEYSKLIVYEKKKMDFMISLIKEIQEDTYYKLFSGFFSLTSRRLIANAQYKDLYLVDDGVYSITIHHQLYSPDIKGYKSYITTQLEHANTNFFKQIVFSGYAYFRKKYLQFLGYKNDMDIFHVNFYTIFDLPQYKNEIIIINNYTFLKTYYKHNTILKKKNLHSKNTVYFLGQPLYNSLPVNYTQYLSYLKTIFTYYIKKNKKIIYIPHRGEEDTTFEDIRSIYPQFIEIRKLSQPFELYLLENNIHIDYLTSFVSSALFTVKKLYPEVNIDAFKFPIKGKYEKNILLIHKMLEKNGAILLDITADNTIKPKDFL